MPQRNLDPKKTPMPQQPARERSANFAEVALGYTQAMAVNEARRCLHCKTHPCVSACPVGVDIPGFLAQVAQGELDAAARTLAADNALPAVCGRVCPQETQCEGACVCKNRGESVAIGRVERFVADWRRAQGAPAPRQAEPNGKRVAVIGSGPSGLTCAGDLARLGYAVTVFEALHVAGGVLMYGIPEFRLPKTVVQAEIDGLRALGVQIETDVVVGRTLTVDELFAQGYQAVFIGSGAGLPRFMGIPGENLKGVYSANEYLTRVNLMQAYLPDSATPIRHGAAVAVVGGGNVAMDAARCARRLGAAEVTILYRRGMAELPARAEEVEHAQEEGIAFRTLVNPVEVLGDEHGWMTAVRCVQMELGAPDESGRRRPVEVPDRAFVVPADTLIVAIGTQPNPLLRQTTAGLETDSHGCLITRNEVGLTSREHVYAGGDAVTGAATVILAMGAGKRAAAAIHQSLTD